MTEIRTTSSTGAQKGVKPARFELLPTDALWELAEHYGKGAEKYVSTETGLDNWRLGYEWSKSFGAAFRHMALALGGEDMDRETGSKHVIAAAWHMLGIAHWMNSPEFAQFDDRQAVIERAAWPEVDPTPEYGRRTP